VRDSTGKTHVYSYNLKSGLRVGGETSIETPASINVKAKMGSYPYSVSITRYHQLPRNINLKEMIGTTTDPNLARESVFSRSELASGLNPFREVEFGDLPVVTGKLGEPLTYLLSFSDSLGVGVILRIDTEKDSSAVIYPLEVLR